MSWIKVATNLESKQEVFGISRRTQLSRTDVVGRLVRFWSWADQHTVDGRLCLAEADVDEITGVAGFAAAMRAEGWLDGRDGSLHLPNFERHNGNSAKARSLEAEAKRLRRLTDNGSVDTSDRVSDVLSDNCPTKPATVVRPDERKTRGREEPLVAKVDRTIGTIGSSARGDRSSQSTKFKLDPAKVDWDTVLELADRVAKRVPPASDEDRRAWFRYAVLATTAFSEHWLIDAAEATVKCLGIEKPQAYFVGVLSSKASESGADLPSLLKAIEIPTHIWKGDACQVITNCSSTQIKRAL